MKTALNSSQHQRKCPQFESSFNFVHPAGNPFHNGKKSRKQTRIPILLCKAINIIAGALWICFDVRWSVPDTKGAVASIGLYTIRVQGATFATPDLRNRGNRDCEGTTLLISAAPADMGLGVAVGKQGKNKPRHLSVCAEAKNRLAGLNKGFLC
jgi:hypothetical protein